MKGPLNNIQSFLRINIISALKQNPSLMVLQQDFQTFNSTDTLKSVQKVFWWDLKDFLYCFWSNLKKMTSFASSFVYLHLVGLFCLSAVGEIFIYFLPRPCVNFINVLRTNFSYEHRFGSFFSSYMFVVKAVLKQHSYEKRVHNCWWNWRQVSFSSTFYKQLLLRQIPKAQKRVSTWLSFWAFGICGHKSCS
jgi:hypothetical protein